MSTSVEITWLLAAVAKGDAVAFERLYGATCANLYGVVLRILRRHSFKQILYIQLEKKPSVRYAGNALYARTNVS